MNTWLVVTAPASREAELRANLAALAHPAERTIVVTSCADSDPIDAAGPWDILVTDLGADVNIARWWNLGLAAAPTDATHVAVIACDVTGPPGAIDDLAARTAAAGCVMAGPALEDDTRILNDLPRTCGDRVPGACFVLDARHGLRVDEAYRWWYADDDLEMRARAVGPVAVFAGTGLTIGPDSELTPERQAWAAEDRLRFVARWGCEPW